MEVFFYINTIRGDFRVRPLLFNKKFFCRIEAARLYLSVVSFNSTIPRELSYILSYFGPQSYHCVCFVLFGVPVD